VATTSGGAGGARARVGPSAAILSASVAVLLGLALWRAGEPNFWGDEVVSIRLARRSWGRLLSGAIYDLVHTPVFYSLLKPWIRVFGEGELRMRLLPIACGVLSLIPAALLCRELRLSRRACALAFAFAATSGFLVYYSQELRPYSLLLLASSTSMWAFARVAVRPEPRPTDWALLAAAQAALGVSHYYGWLTIGAAGLYLLVVRPARVLRFVLATLPAVAAFLPWAVLVLRRIHGGLSLTKNLKQLTPPGPVDALGFYSGIVGPFRAFLPASQVVVGTAVFLLPALWITARALRASRLPADGTADARGAVGFLATFAFVPLLVSLLVSWFLRPVFLGRYLIGSVYPFLLLCAVGIDAIPVPALRWAVAAASLGWSAYGAVDRITRPDRIAWGRLVAALKLPACQFTSAGGGRTIYVLGSTNRRGVWYYKRRLGVVGKVVVLEDLSELPREGGWLMFCSGPDLERAGPRHREGGEPSYWRCLPSEQARNALRNGGHEILCEAFTGTPREAGRAVSFGPAS